MQPEEYSALIYSPQWCALLLGHFLSGYQSQRSEGTPLLLSLLALPICLNQAASGYLSAMNSTSTLNSFISDGKRRPWLKGIGSTIDNYRDIARNALVYLSTRERLTVSDRIVLETLMEYRNQSPSCRQHTKAAHMWGMICGKEDISSLLSKLEVPVHELHY